MDQDEPECWREAQERGNDCPYCTNERCGQHNFDPCDCDVIDRHTGPFYMGP